MFLHVGSDVVVSLSHVLAILDLKSSQVGNPTREFLDTYRRGHQVTDISGGDAKSLVLTDEGVYLSPISSLTLLKRADFLNSHVLLDLGESTS